MSKLKTKKKIKTNTKSNVKAITKTKSKTNIKTKINTKKHIKKNKTVFINFATGSEDYMAAGNRLLNQAKQSNLFDKLQLFTVKDLHNDKTFWSKHSKFIENNKKGYGYWLWKPYIILKTMNTMKDGDVLLYADSGCEINYKNSKEMNLLKNYFNIVKKDKIIYSDTRKKEYIWSKMDLIKKLNMDNNKYTLSNQREATTILFFNCNKTRAFVNEWYKICCNYHLIDDTPSISKNLEGFIENRHDQSVFSLLTKKYNFNSKLSLYKVIYTIRNRTGITKIINNSKKWYHHR